MSEISSSPDQPPESLPQALDGRFASLVHIMKGRRSPFSRLGVLELDAGLLSLYDAIGTTLFAVPASTVRARPQRRLVALHQVFFQVHAGDRWWYLVAHVPTKYERGSTRELVQRYRARELAPRPGAMSEATYLRLAKNPTTHQLVWAGCWLEALNRAGKPDDSS